MTTLPPVPHRWRPAILTLHPSPDGSGHEGVLTIEGVTCIYFRRWRKVSSHVVAEAQHASDAEFEEIEAQLVGRVGG